MKFIEHYDNIGWKVHELVWNLHEIEFALLWYYPTNGVIDWKFTNWKICVEYKFLELNNAKF